MLTLDYHLVFLVFRGVAILLSCRMRIVFFFVFFLFFFFKFVEHKLSSGQGAANRHLIFIGYIILSRVGSLWTLTFNQTAPEAFYFSLTDWPRNTF